MHRLPAFSPPVLHFYYAKKHFLCAPQMRFAEGDYIFRQGAAGDTFYVISKGQVKFLGRAKWHFPRKTLPGQDASCVF